MDRASYFQSTSAALFFNSLTREVVVVAGGRVFSRDTVYVSGKEKIFFLLLTKSNHS